MYIQEKTIDYLAVLCILLLLVSTVLLYHKVKECKYLDQTVSVQKSNYETLKKIISRNMKAVIYSDNIQLDKGASLYMYRNNKKDSVSIRCLKHKNILFVPRQSCNVCYDEVYDALLYAKDSLNYDVITVTEKEKYNEVRSILYDMGFNVDVYYSDSPIFLQSLSIEYAPFFSYVDERLKCCHSFIPLPNYPEYSYLYLKAICEKYKRD